ncbi:hypothetical protein GCM10010357_04910 [Streptomyces luteireticuli]|uniref:Uncharacterized protein n=1 Tax=Streptomyces luteireticuli TaxID=173858 RepID=A0ABN0Y8M0_9ACTN
MDRDPEPEERPRGKKLRSVRQLIISEGEVSAQEQLGDAGEQVHREVEEVRHIPGPPFHCLWGDSGGTVGGSAGVVPPA